MAMFPLSTLRGLILAEMERPECIELRWQFDLSIESKRAPNGTVDDSNVSEELTPEWEMYDDDDGKEGIHNAPAIEIEPTPEAGDSYVNVNIMLPRGDSVAREQVTWDYVLND